MSHYFLRQIYIIVTICLTLFYSPVNAQATGLNFDRAEIRSVIAEFSIRTGKIFIVDPRVSGDITIISPKDGVYTSEEVWEVFKAAILVSGFSVIQVSDNQYRIVPLQGSVRGGVAYDKGLFVVEIIYINNLDVREALQSVQGIVSEGSYVTTLRSINAIIVADTRKNIRKIKKLLSKIDSPYTKRRVYQLRYLSVEKALKIIDTVFSQKSGLNRGTFTAIDLKETNKLIVTASRKVLDEIGKLLIKIDNPPSLEDGLKVINLNNINADEAATTIQSVLGKDSSSEVLIVANKETNSLIINAPSHITKQIISLVKELDIRKSQVLVEAIVVQLSNRSARDIGIQYFHTGKKGLIPFTSSTFSNTTTPNLLGIAAASYLNTSEGASLNTTVGSTITQGVVNSLLNSQGFTLGATGSLKDGSVIGSMLKAIETDSQSNILSTPSLMTVDGEKATIQVGQNIPIKSGESIGQNSGNVFKQVQRQDIGIILEIEPQINPDGTVKLIIKQEISSIDTALSVGTDDFAINKTVVNTVLLAQDGEILVIGGLIDDDVKRSEKKVPLLGDIPILGTLFKSSGKESRKRNLSIFIRPKIVKNNEDTKNIYDAVRRRANKKILFEGVTIEDSIHSLLLNLPTKWYQKDE